MKKAGEIRETESNVSVTPRQEEKKQKEGERERERERGRRKRREKERRLIAERSSLRSVHRGRDKHLSRSRTRHVNCESRWERNLESYEFCSSSPSPSISLALLFRSVCCPFLVHDPPSFLPLPPFLPTCTQFSLVSSFLPFSGLFSRAYSPWSVGYSFGRSVCACARYRPCVVASTKDLARTNERGCTRERTSDPAVIVRAHRSQRFPLCSLSRSLFPPFLPPSPPLFLSLLVSFPRLSFFPSLPLHPVVSGAHQAHTHTVLSKIRQQRAGAARSCHCCNCLVFARSLVNTLLQPLSG